METLQITKENARKAFKDADPNGKKLLAKLLGENNLYEKITDRVSGWNDILEVSGRDPKEFEFRPDETDDELAYRQAKLIASVLNEGVVLDAKDTSQTKYFPWCNIDAKSGFGLSCDDYVNWSTLADVGVHLCLKDPTLAKFAFEICPEVYSKLLI